MFECSICLLEKEESPVHVTNDAACLECFKTELFPRFQAALKHEVNWPVKWGSVDLELQDFAEYVDDYSSFQHEWNAKQAEYKTPVKQRLYCAKDSLFLGWKCSSLSHHRGCRVLCRECGLATCAHCHELTEDIHACEGTEPHDRFAGLLKGKDYQLCPVDATPLALEDGCNAVVCPACNNPICYICSELRPNANHYDKGGCPRFGQPDATNALYNDEVVEVEDEIRGQEVVQLVIGLHEFFPRPRPRIHDDDSKFNRLLQEQVQASVLESTRPGQLMLRHREMLRQVLQRTGEQLLQSVPQNQTRPWLEPLLEAALKLITNIDVYVFRVRIEVAMEHYSRRHQEILRFIQDHSSPEMFAAYPDLFEILAVYLIIAPTRLGEAGHL